MISGVETTIEVETSGEVEMKAEIAMIGLETWRSFVAFALQESCAWEHGQCLMFNLQPRLEPRQPPGPVVAQSG